MRLAARLVYPYHHPRTVDLLAKLVLPEDPGVADDLWKRRRKQQQSVLGGGPAHSVQDRTGGEFHRAGWHLDPRELLRQKAEGLVGERVLVALAKLPRVLLRVEQLARRPERVKKGAHSADGRNRRQRLGAGDHGHLPTSGVCAFPKGELWRETVPRLSCTGVRRKEPLPCPPPAALRSGVRGDRCYLSYRQPVPELLQLNHRVLMPNIRGGKDQRGRFGSHYHAGKSPMHHLGRLGHIGLGDSAVCLREKRRRCHHRAFGCCASASQDKTRPSPYGLSTPALALPWPPPGPFSCS